MKERITYILADGERGVDPATVHVTHDAVKLPGFKAAKEWRLTLSTADLPESLQEVLKHSHELHLRWTSSKHAYLPAPFSSRTPPGLHVLYTPIRNADSGNDVSSPDLCDEIKNIFGKQLRCDATSHAFSRQGVLSERFAMSSSFQYFQQLPLITDLQDYLRLHYCTNSKAQTICTQRIETLQQASTIDFDYDAISQSVVVTATWPPAHHSHTDEKRSKDDRVEIGMLSREDADEAGEIALGGYLTVLGEDDQPKGTLFSFPSRHHQLPQSGPTGCSFSTTFKQPTGLHPTLQLRFDKATLKAPAPSCSLHAYFTLPSTLFIDRYQFSDDLFLESQHLIALRSLTGETDLEKPDWVIHKWGSAALFELATPTDKNPATKDHWTVKIPFHLRYLPPRTLSNDSSIYADYLASSYPDFTGEPSKRTTFVPYPAVFWACPAENGLKMAVNPFDRVNLGYDGLFGPKTLFWHVRPTAQSDDLHVRLDVPVLDLAKTQHVETGTGLAVLLGFLWICWKLLVGTWGRRAVVVVGDKKHQ